jgi:hypothetical protein
MHMFNSNKWGHFDTKRNKNLIRHFCLISTYRIKILVVQYATRMNINEQSMINTRLRHVIFSSFI